jgi:hypothetical protein
MSIRRACSATAKAAVLILGAGALFASGCGSSARISSAAGGKDQSVSYESATFQLARGHLVGIVLFRRTPAPFGDPDPDFEYVFFQVPERNRFGWVREDNLPVYRWVRENGKDQLWQGTAGEGSLRFGILTDKGHIHFNFHVTMSPIHDTAGGVYVFSGNVKCTEDLPRTQGLMNRYGEWLERILATKPAEESRRSRDESAGPQPRPPRNPMP